jgi:hypothetical protein
MRPGCPLIQIYRTAERPCLVHVGAHAIGTKRFAAVSSDASFAQVAGAILGIRSLLQNPDKDEVRVLPALGSTCGRRGPYPTVLGRPAPDNQAHFSLGPVSRGTASSAQAAPSGSPRLKNEWVHLGQYASRDPGHSILTRERRPARDGGLGG